MKPDRENLCGYNHGYEPQSKLRSIIPSAARDCSTYQFRYASLSELEFHNKSLQPFANRLRKEMTKAEACLWKYVLRAGQMRDYQFRRQRPVLNYIADFMCKELCLIIEVDGITHDYRLDRDELRTEELRRAGFNVYRFTDEEVLTNIQGVASQIERIIEDLTTPYPRQRGTSPCAPSGGGQRIPTSSGVRKYVVESDRK